MEQSAESLFFVYGWQLDAALLARCCPQARVVTTARLAGHALDFFGYNAKWDGAEESVVERAGSEVWGLVLALGAADVERLDGMQNVRGDGSGGYFHCPAEVVGADGLDYDVLLYMKTVLGEPRTPSQEYRQHIAEGALACGLPPAYAAGLQAFPAHPAGYGVPRGLRVIPVLAAGGDCHCSF